MASKLSGPSIRRMTALSDYRDVIDPEQLANVTVAQYSDYLSK